MAKLLCLKLNFIPIYKWFKKVIKESLSNVKKINLRIFNYCDEDILRILNFCEENNLKFVNFCEENNLRIYIFLGRT